MSKKIKTRRHKRNKTKRRQTKRLSFFSAPEKNYTQKILVNPHRQSGNMIKGLRNM